MNTMPGVAWCVKLKLLLLVLFPEWHHLAQNVWTIYSPGLLLVIDDYFYYYSLNSLSVFSLVKSLQLILEISATYRSVSHLLADNWLSCRLHLCNVWFPITKSIQVPCVFVNIFFKTMYNKTIIVNYY